jgi:DNA mismatch repair protein MSH5
MYLTTPAFSELLDRNELNILLDERMTEQEKTELTQCEEICRRFLGWDLTGLVAKNSFEEVRPLLSKVINSM